MRGISCVGYTNGFWELDWTGLCFFPCLFCFGLVFHEYLDSTSRCLPFPIFLIPNVIDNKLFYDYLI